MANNAKIIIKLTFISGLNEIVSEEIKQHPEINIAGVGDAEIYVDLVQDFKDLTKLRSITNAFVVKQGVNFNPRFISNHKSILGELVEMVLKNSTDKFNTFRISCAGRDSKEVEEIVNYLENAYKLSVAETADLDIYIGKNSDIWEVGVRITKRPLTLREYRVENIEGGLNSTIAYVMNTFCNIVSIKSYLNIFSGSGTLLIEAGLSNPKIKLVGFDVNGKSNSQAIKNIKKAGLIKLIQIKTADIFKKPDVGTFDAIVSDLPFGMKISKNEDIEKLYRSFIEYSENFLNLNGTLVVYTTEHKLLKPLLEKSQFKLTKILDLKVSTITNSYIYPKIFVCKLF